MADAEVSAVEVFAVVGAVESLEGGGYVFAVDVAVVAGAAGDWMNLKWHGVIVSGSARMTVTGQDDGRKVAVIVYCHWG